MEPQKSSWERKGERRGRAVRTRAHRAVVALTTVAVAASIQAYQASRAHACGGFFCSRAAPVVQAAEEIVFVQNSDDTVTAVIRINYQGPSQKFAWVLPIQGAPSKVEVSSNLAFNGLHTATDPTYTVMTTVEGTCKVEPVRALTGSAPGIGSGPQTAPAPSMSPAVTVIDQGTVGPYDFEVISVDATLSDPADVAVKWLVDHGYDVTDLGPAVLRPYLADGLNLMAFKLTKGASASTGSIRPVMVTFNSKLPSIPIRPTAVAAQPNMGILVYVVSDAQAVPKNYKSLVLNEALINWFAFSSNYRAVVTAAAGEAGGQGFVTEMAGDSQQLKDLVYTPGQKSQWMQYSSQTFLDGYAAIQQASQFSGWDGFQDAVCAGATLPSSISCPMFASNPTAYRSMVQVDTTKFLTALYEGAVKPMIATQALILSRPYVTRLFTTMSPEDMTLDPAFDFNPDLADLSNRHTATRIVSCSADVTLAQAPWRLQLPQGGVVAGTGSSWPFSVGSSLPANLKVVELGTSGGGKVVEDNGAMILKMLAQTGSGAAAGSGSSQKPSDQRVAIGGGTGGTGGRGGVPIGGAAGSGGTTGSGSGGTGSGGSHGGGCSAAGSGAERAADIGWCTLALSLLLARRGRRTRA